MSGGFPMFSIAPSLMCANLLEMGREVRELERAGAHYFHIDVMDGHFVPNLGLNFDLVRKLRNITAVPLDVHLMVDTPEDYVGIVESLKVPCVSFHLEASRNPIRLARAFRAVGAKAGIALNPATPASAIQYLLHEIDYVLVMTVEPGFAGQKFIASMYDKIGELRAMVEPVQPRIFIEVDGNLNAETSSRCIERGASILVGGTSSVFRRQAGPHADFLSFRDEVEHLLTRSRNAASH